MYCTFNEIYPHEVKLKTELYYESVIFTSQIFFSLNLILVLKIFQVAEEDGFPSSVCYRCMFNLENYYDFYETCIRAQTLLQSKIGEGGDSSASMNNAIAAATPAVKEENTAGLPNAER